ncbi:MAG TPA: hypothetical protein VHV10_05925, partial [Ktedonobacteraceae bacterium]|nr:hypothetical protein [Ktedonobacteraceae bacterium]
DASDQPYAIKEYHGDRDEEYKVAIKAARETRVAQKIRIFKDGEAVEKAGAIASNRVNGSASQASRELMQQVATAQVLTLEQDRDPGRAIQRTGLDTVKESLSQASRKFMQQFATAQIPELEQVSRRLLDNTKSEAEKNIEKHAKKIAMLLYGNKAISITERTIIERTTYVENAKSTFESIVRNTERMSQLRGEDRITQHAAIAEAVTSYAAYLTELTSATSIASRDAAAIATLAGRNDKSYARETAKAVLLRADIARHEAVLEGKSPIDQYAAAAAGARRFAQVQVELGRSAKAAAKAAEDRARAEGLPTNAGPNDRSQETEKQKAAGKVIDAFRDSRILAAGAKTKQAQEDLVIYAREIAELRGVRGDRNQQNIVNTFLQNLRIDQTRAKLAYLVNPETIEEGLAQVVIARVRTAQAKRDTARSIKAWAEVQEVPNREQNQIIQREIAYIDAETKHGRNERGGNVLDKAIVASEIATFMAARQHAIESATKDASATAERMGLPHGVAPGRAQPQPRTTQRGDAQIIEREIMTAIEGAEWRRVEIGVQRGNQGLINREINGGENHLNAHRFAAEFAAQVASTQRSRLTAVLAARKVTQLARVPHGEIATETVGRIDTAIDNANRAPFLPADIPAGYNRDILQASIKARLALRAATAEAKSAQAVEASALALASIATRANSHLADAALAHVVNPISQAAAEHALNILNAPEVIPEKALIAVLQNAEACHKIANMVGEVEENVRYSARIAGRDQAAQDQNAREAVQRLLNAANEVWQAEGRNQALEAVQAAQKFASSEAQIKNAVERLSLNGQANAQQNAENLLRH